MIETDFKLFLRDIALALFALIFTFFLCNMSGLFEDPDEVGTEPLLMSRSLKANDSVNPAEIVFAGNSHTYFMNPVIIDAITQKSSHCFGIPNASIAQLSWFFSSSWDHLNPKLIVLETHSFKSILSNARNKLDSVRYQRWENDHTRFTPWSKTESAKFQNQAYNSIDAITDLLNPFTKKYSLIDYDPYEVYERIYFSEKSPSKGFRRSHYAPISDSLMNRYRNGWISTSEDHLIDLKVLSIVEKLIRDCQSQGIKVLIYESPMYYKHIADQRKRNIQLDSFSKTLGVPLVNLSLDTTLTRNSNYFENTNTMNQHLTIEGADAVSRVLANKIVQLNLLSKK